MDTEKTANGAGESSPAHDGSTITAKDGLLWRNGRIIELPEADLVAREHGFTYAEQFVKHLSNAGAEARQARAQEDRP
jgi:hypothetical protein